MHVAEFEAAQMDGGYTHLIVTHKFRSRLSIYTECQPEFIVFKVNKNKKIRLMRLVIDINS